MWPAHFSYLEVHLSSTVPLSKQHMKIVVLVECWIQVHFLFYFFFIVIVLKIKQFFSTLQRPVKPIILLK